MIAQAHNRPRRLGGAAAALPLIALAASAGVSIARAQSRPAPPGVYVGSLVYFDHCAACHGVAATGTRLAPDLLALVSGMDEARFERVLESGYPGIENGPAPWAQIAEVERYAAELWAYLEARATGAVEAGELTPERR